MAYNWDFNKKAGTITFDGVTRNFYKGNGFMIVLDEWKDEKTAEDLYHVVWFFIDKQHAKRCLGLEKGSYDMFEGNVDKIVIYKDHCDNWKDIVDIFTKSQPNIVIEIHPKERKEVA